MNKGSIKVMLAFGLCLFISTLMSTEDPSTLCWAHTSVIWDCVSRTVNYELRSYGEKRVLEMAQGCEPSTYQHMEADCILY